MPANLISKLVVAATIAWSHVVQLGPYVAAGVLLAALLDQLDLARRWGGWLKRSGPGALVGTACLGGISPLCTYGTVPVLVELLRAGASPAPALTFLVASSLLNPQMFVVVAGGLGLRLAVAYAGGVLALSLPVGLLTRRTRPTLFLNEGVLSPVDDPASRAQQERTPFFRHLLHLTEMVGLTFVLGVILAGLVQALIPASWISSLLGTTRWYGVLLAGVLGVPFYACGGGAVPIIAALVAQGMSPGAALAFILAGPATRLTSLAAMGTLLNRRALAIYVGYVVIGAALAGTALNLAAAF